MQTITLHNIRYEVRSNGGQVWVQEGEHHWVVGSVFRTEDGRRWQAWYKGSLVGAFETEELAREVIEAILKVEMKGSG